MIIVFLYILIEGLLTISLSLNAIVLGVAMLQDFNVWGLILTIVFLWLGCRYFCRVINSIKTFKKYFNS